LLTAVELEEVRGKGWNQTKNKKREKWEVYIPLGKGQGGREKENLPVDDGRKVEARWSGRGYWGEETFSVKGEVQKG